MFRYKKNAMDFVKRQNLNMRTFAQFGGKYHRNLFTLEHVSHYLFVIVTHNILDNILITVFQHQDGYIDKDTQFILHNIQWFCVFDIYFSIYLPLKHIFRSRQHLPGLWWKENHSQDHHFFIRQHVLQPRRDFIPFLCQNQRKTKFSYIKRGFLKRSRRNLFEKYQPCSYKVVRKDKDILMYARSTGTATKQKAIPTVKINVKPVKGAQP